jgi:hypothetical protein
MDRKTKAAFELAVATYDAQATLVQHTAQRKAEERAGFIAGFEQARKTVVLPALEEVSEMLKARGWTCRITELEKPIGISLEIYRRNMTTAPSSQMRPHIQFSAEPENLKVETYWATQSQRAPDRNNLEVDQLTARQIQSEALKFFEVLAAEPVR